MIGQREVLDVFKENPSKWYTTREMREVFDGGDVKDAMGNLLRRGYIRAEKLDGDKRKLKYQFRRDMKNKPRVLTPGYSTAVFDAWKGVR